jgi:CheY-like chemotaxis protein
MAKVLVVDDDEADRLGLAAMLQGAGHDVLVARDGDEALELYVAQKIHVIVTDMVMPGRDGLSLISALRNVDPAAMIIAISGKSRSQLEASKVFGARRILAKPIDPDALIAAVAEVMGAADEG